MGEGEGGGVRLVRKERNKKQALVLDPYLRTRCSQAASRGGKYSVI